MYGAQVGVTTRTGAYRLKVGSDVVGTAKGLLTIPMALFGFLALPAGLLVALRQDWPPVLFGLAAVLACSVLARLLERLVVAIDDIAASAIHHGLRRRARVAAIVSGALPVMVVFAAEILSLRGVIERGAASPVVPLWLWGYGVATAPWTLFAQQVSRFRRTLVGIRAYAGHVMLWLFVPAALWLDAPLPVVVVALIFPAILPFTVGLLLALSDREAIANVRV